MRTIVADNRGLIYKIAHRALPLCVNDPAICIEDLTQAGGIGVINAAQTYDETRGSWASWAALHIRNEINAALGIKAGNMTHIPAASLDAPIGDDEDATTLADVVADPGLTPEERVMIETERRLIQAAFEALPEDEREMAELMRQGLSCAAAGRRMAIKPHRAQALRKHIMQHLSTSPIVCEILNLNRDVNYYGHKSVQSFYNTNSSVVEDAVLARERIRERIWQNNQKNSRA